MSSNNTARVYFARTRFLDTLLIANIRDAYRCAKGLPPVKLRGGKFKETHRLNGVQSKVGLPMWQPGVEIEKTIERLYEYVFSPEFEKLCAMRRINPVDQRQSILNVLDGKDLEEVEKLLKQINAQERINGKKAKREWEDIKRKAGTNARAAIASRSS